MTVLPIKKQNKNQLIYSWLNKGNSFLKLHFVLQQTNTNFDL